MDAHIVILANLHTVKSFLTSFLIQSYSLERYRSKEEKLELLDEAIATFDGGTITTVRNSLYITDFEVHKTSVL